MHSLDPFRLATTALVGSAFFDLRVAAAKLALTSPTAGLHLGQLTAGSNDALVRLPWRVMNGATGLPSPTLPDPWMIAAGELHDAVSDAYDAIVGLLEAAWNHHKVPIPEGARVLPGDRDLFGFGPSDEAFEGWTSPDDSDALATLQLAVGSPAWTRRVSIVWSADRWAVAHKAALDASGASTLNECARELGGVLASIRDAMRAVPTSTVDAAKAKARAAVRALVEIGDDPGNLVGIARAYAAEQEVPASLAWSVLADLLTHMSEQ